jgi:putative molybdopterin biosynthesis protein
VTGHGVLADDASDVAAALEELASRHDAVVTSGSTSASEGDVIHRIVEERGDLVQHGVDLKPGKPTVLGALDGTPVFGLPGNPISALTVFRTLIAPALRDAVGLPERRDVVERPALARDVPTPGGRTRLLPVGLVECPERGVLCHELDKGSGATTSLAHADGYVVVDGPVERLERDDAVDVHLLDAGVRPPSVVAAGPPDSVVEELLPSDARWLDAGSSAAARKLRDGVVDLAGLRDARDALADIGLTDAVLVGGYERSVGICGDPDGASVAVADDDRGLVEDGETVDVSSPRSVAPAVADGAAAAGVCTRRQAVDAGLPFEPRLWERYDLLFRRERLPKPAVAACREDLAAAVEDTEGYRSTDETGERLERWSG